MGGMSGMVGGGNECVWGVSGVVGGDECMCVSVCVVNGDVGGR